MVYFWLSKEGRLGFKGWDMGWVESCLNLGCSLQVSEQTNPIVRSCELAQRCSQPVCLRTHLKEPCGVVQKVTPRIDLSVGSTTKPVSVFGDQRRRLRHHLLRITPLNESFVR